MNKIISICILAFLTSCVNSGGGDKSIPDNCLIIDVLEGFGEPENIDVLFQKIVPLETTGNCVIGSVSKILADSANIIVLDCRKSNSVFWFSGEGDFKRKINSIGKAEGEYLSLRDFSKKSNGDGCFVCDKRLKKILFYNNNGEYVEESPLKTRISSIVNVTDSSFLVHNNSREDSFLELWDSSFNTKQKFLTRPEYVKNYFIGAEFSLKENISTKTITFYPPFSNVIYNWVNGEMVKVYLIENKELFPNKAFFDDHKGRHPGLLLEELKKQNYITFLDFIENSEILILKYYRGEQKIITLFNKQFETSVSYKVGNSCIANLIFNAISITGDGQFISYVFPYQIDNMSNCNVLMDQISAPLNKNNNPYVVYFNVGDEKSFRNEK